jgi:hypothetical protein
MEFRQVPIQIAPVVVRVGTAFARRLGDRITCHGE